MTKIVYQLIQSGMGGFLNPPLHPEHSWSLASGDGGGMSLSSAIGCEWLSESSKKQARVLLDKWEHIDKLPISDARVQDWIYHILGYFCDCYAKPDNEGAKDRWDIDQLDMDSQVNPMTKIDLHAGVHFIRKYYPDYCPTQQDFDNAYWGTKKVIKNEKSN